tara:strand:- start:33 stop:170 length:138 start_codon:yes stop_codon:yes gene_type:complete
MFVEIHWYHWVDVALPIRIALILAVIQTRDTNYREPARDPTTARA